MTDLTRVLRDLSEKAGKATPGPWAWYDDAMVQAAELATVLDERKREVYETWLTPIIETDGGHYGPREPDRAYLAACPPALIQALVEVALADLAWDAARTDTDLSVTTAERFDALRRLEAAIGEDATATIMLP